MFDLLIRGIASTTATIVFISIFLGGCTFSVLSILLGGHGDTDHDVGHDADHSGDHDTDHHDGGQDHDGGISHFFTVGMLSVRGAALMSTGFGGAGAIAQISTGKVFFSTTVGLVVGYSFAFAILYTLKAFKSQQANSLIDTSTAVGSNGMVVTSIPKGGYGEIRCVISGTEFIKAAVSKDGGPIKSGTRVKIEETDGGAVVVAPLNII